MKLSALHPRYHPSQGERLHAELVPRLRDLALAMREAWLPLTIDAEEADRLDLSLSLFEAVLTDPRSPAGMGLGLRCRPTASARFP